MVEKLIVDGQVAVIISAGFGAGWSTWGDEREEMLFDPEIARLVSDKAGEERIKHVAGEKWPGALVPKLEVRWLPVGTQFYINEYDGSESIVIITPDLGYIA